MYQKQRRNVVDIMMNFAGGLLIEKSLMVVQSFFKNGAFPHFHKTKVFSMER